MSAVTELTGSSLTNADEIHRGDYDVLVDVRAICPNSGSGTSVGDLSRRGSCGCTTESNSGKPDRS
ncbi:rod-determining factor RdfA [Halorubrum ezzemoulense]|uniref:rod-determining factor RdfA n=1 Tax=Halorubrum ezzemoulense TaxID=337243 RepID=UPI0031837D3F